MAVPPGRALSSGEPGGRLCADLRQDHADVRSWQLGGQGNGTETSVCAADEISDGSGGYKAKSEIDLKIARPLCATMAKMHRACQDNYVTQNGRVRRLTPRECARLQGFQDSFVIPVSDSQAYKQFGNAVTVNVSKAVAQSVKTTLINLGEWKD